MLNLPVVNPSTDPDVLVFSVEDIRELRDHFGILGTLIGTLPQYPQQNVFLSVPLRLMVWEVLWMLDQGEAQLVDYVRYRRSRKAQSSNTVLLDKSGTYESVTSGGNFITTANGDLITDPTSIISPQEYLDSYVKNTSLTLAQVSRHYKTYRHIKSLGYFISPGLKFGGDFVIYPGDPLKFHSYSIVKFNVTEANDIVVGGRLATSVKKTFVLVHEPEDEHEEDFASLFPELAEVTGDSTSEEPRADKATQKYAFSIQWAGFG